MGSEMCIRDRPGVVRVNFALTDSTAIGVKGRRVAFASFSDATSIDRVRSHAPSRLSDGTDTGLTALTTGGLVMYGFGLNLKYQFSRP